MHIKNALRKMLITRWTNMTLEGFAELLNPKIRGWMNSYTKYSKYETYLVFYYLKTIIRSWVKNKYIIIGKAKMYDKYRAIQHAAPDLFYNWRKGILT
ncbi:MAG: group II intron maturase-specific domain-containing protein [Bacteroidota bacterium]|nr:group II intron maturase-specific domain-containing protein [Bacteroidota bacterium]